VLNFPEEADVSPMTCPDPGVDEPYDPWKFFGEVSGKNAIGV
jgi:hypothetical protein